MNPYKPNSLSTKIIVLLVGVAGVLLALGGEIHSALMSLWVLMLLHSTEQDYKYITLQGEVIDQLEKIVEYHTNIRGEGM